MTNRKRYTVSDINTNRFYQTPKFLFEGEFKKITNDAKVLYSLLKDRHELSLKNNWVNDNNEVFLVYTRENMADMLCVTQPTLRKAIDQLKQFGLMEEERVGLNKPNRIYLTAVDLEFSGLKESFSPECKNLSVKSEIIFQSKVKESFTQECKNLSPNDTNFNNTDLNNQSIYQPEEIQKNNDGLKDGLNDTNIYKTYKNIISENINYKFLKSQYIGEEEIIDEILELLTETVSSKKAQIRVCGEDTAADIVKSQLLKLNYEHITYVITSLNENQNKVQNIKAYLLTALYNAPKTCTTYYKNCANVDMRDGKTGFLMRMNK